MNKDDITANGLGLGEVAEHKSLIEKPKFK